MGEGLVPGRGRGVVAGKLLFRKLAIVYIVSWQGEDETRHDTQRIGNMAFRPATLHNPYEPHGEVTTRLWLLLPLRFYVGIYFVLSSISKVADGFLVDPQKLTGLLRPAIEAPGYPYPFYRPFFHGMVEPYPGLFVFLVVFGELLTGMAIATGTLTRLACLVGIFLVANFAVAFGVGLAMPHNTTTFAVMMLVLLLTGGGRAYGVDHYLRGKMPAWMV